MMKYISVSDFMTNVTILLLVAFVILLVLSSIITYMVVTLRRLESDLDNLNTRINRLEDKR